MATMNAYRYGRVVSAILLDDKFVTQLKDFLGPVAKLYYDPTPGRAACKARGKILARLIWEWAGNDLPPKGYVIDHINRDPTDNRLKNLRVLSISENCMNSISRKNRQSRYRGVYQHGKKWRTTLKVNGRFISKGGFETQEEAHDHYKRLCAEHRPFTVD